MIGSLPGLVTAILGMATVALGVIGILVHLVVAATIGRKSPNAMSTTAGPIVCFFVGMIGARIGEPLDDVAIVIPCVGVVGWIATSVALGLRGGAG